MDDWQDVYRDRRWDERLWPCDQTTSLFAPRIGLEMSRVSKNIIFNLIGQALIVGLGFVGTRLVFSRLGEESLGILYFALAIYAVITPLLDMGLSSTLIREVASHLNTDPQYVFRLSQTSTLFCWAGYLVLGAAIWLGTPWLVLHWISIKTLDATTAEHALRILALSLLLMLPRSLYSNLLRGVQRMEFNNFIDVGTIAVHQLGTVLVVMLGGGIVQIAYCYLATLLLSNVAYMVVAARFFPWRSLFPGFSRDVVRRNFSFTSHMAAFAVLGTIQMESDKALISKFLPIGLVGFYGVAQTLVARVSRVPGAVNQAAFPNFSARFGNDDHAGLMREYRRLQDLVCYGLVPIFAVIIFAARPLFTYLLSAQAAKLLFLPTVFLCFGWYMNGTLHVPFALSLAVGRPDINAKLNFYALFLVLPLTVGLIWKLGLVGAGVASVVYNLFAYIYAVRRWTSECMGTPPRDWYLHVLKILALGSATYGTAWFALALAAQDSVVPLVIGYILASVAFLYAGYQGLGPDLREGFDTWRAKLAEGVSR
jgi:O-antigen/teichoic acid export membrane protein